MYAAGLIRDDSTSVAMLRNVDTPLRRDAMMVDEIGGE